MTRDHRFGSSEAGFGRFDSSVPWDDAELDADGSGFAGVHEAPAGTGTRGETTPGFGHERGLRQGRGNPDVAPHETEYPSHGHAAHERGNPDVAPYPRVRTFARRGDRMSDTLERTFEKYKHAYLLDLERGTGVTMVADTARLDPRIVFGREAPLIVEVGCGNGEQITAAAAANPDINYLGFEVWMPGVAKAVSSAVRNYGGLANLRLADVDALQALPILFADFAASGRRDAAAVVVDDDIDAVRAAFARSRGVHEVPMGMPADSELAVVPGSESADSPEEGAGFGLAPHETGANPRGTNRKTSAQAVGIISELWTFFADPWPKTRHRKRRLVAPEFAGIAAALLVDGGLWRLATDWADYAWQMRDVIESTPGLENVYAGERPDEEDPAGPRGGFAPRFEGRVRTAFERRAGREGREVRDLCARRVLRRATE